MRRPARRLFTLCSAASLGLLVVIGAVAVVSEVREEHATSIAISRDTYFAAFSDGCLWLAVQSVTPDDPSPFREADTSRLHEIAMHCDYSRSSDIPSRRLGRRTLLRSGMPGGSGGMRTVSGFDAWHLAADVITPPSHSEWRAIPARRVATPGDLRFTYSGIAIPYWCAILATALLPVLYLVAAHRRASRRALGLCDVCGYDLRATPGRCPECGAAAARAESPG